MKRYCKIWLQLTVYALIFPVLTNANFWCVCLTQPFPLFTEAESSKHDRICPVPNVAISLNPYTDCSRVTT
jgi:hypothetical protein